MNFDEILKSGYTVEIRGLTKDDYVEDPDLFDVEAYRVDVTTPQNQLYQFNFEFDAPFELALEEAFEYISITNN